MKTKQSDRAAELARDCRALFEAIDAHLPEGLVAEMWDAREKLADVLRMLAAGFDQWETDDIMREVYSIIETGESPADEEVEADA